LLLKKCVFRNVSISELKQICSCLFTLTCYNIYEARTKKDSTPCEGTPHDVLWQKNHNNSPNIILFSLRAAFQRNCIEISCTE
jgi:hypothetical protein